MKIVPQQSRVVVEPIPNEGAIVIPDMDLKDEDGNKIEQPKRYRVVAIGTGRVLDSGVVIDIPLKVGDEVALDFRFAIRLFPPFVGGRNLIIFDYAGVIAKIDRDNPSDGIGMGVESQSRILRAGVGPRPGTPIRVG